MGEKITQEMVSQISSLARLRLEPEEIVLIQKDMQQMLDFTDILNGMNTEGVAPMVHPVTYGNVFRSDEAVSCITEKDILACVPGSPGEQYLVPIILEQGGEDDE